VSPSYRLTDFRTATRTRRRAAGGRNDLLAMRSILHAASFLLGLLVIGWIFAHAARYFISPRGAIGPTLLHAQSPIAAFIAVLICSAIGVALASALARLKNAAWGVFLLGGGFFVLAARFETATEFAFASAAAAGRTQLALLGVETILWAFMSLIGVWLVFVFGGRLRDIAPPDDYRPPPHPIWSWHALKAAAAGVIVLPAVWFVAQSAMVGQVVASVFLGAMVASMVGRLVSPNVQPVLLLVSPIVFGAVGHFIGAVVLKSPLDVSMVAGQISPLNLPMPIDYAAGSLMGGAFGLGWARSFLHHEGHATEPRHATG
jgi:hypothetical protein